MKLERVLLALLWIFLTIGIFVTFARSQEYPNTILTPGKILTTDAKVVCKPGYAKRVRHVSQAEKRKVYHDYQTEPGKGRCAQGCEVDHLISLELGGSNDPDNLWPEPYFPEPGARTKDKVENWLHRQVCSGKMPLVKAQALIVEDWYHIWMCEMGKPDLTVKGKR